MNAESVVQDRTTIGATEIEELRAALGAIGYEPAGRREDPRTAALPNDLAPRIPGSVALELLADAHHRLNDPLVGLHAAEQASPRGFLAHLLFSSASLGDALAAFGRFCHLLVDTMRADLERAGATASLVYHFDDPVLANDRRFPAYVLMATVRVFRGAMGPAFRLHHVAFRHCAVAGEAAEASRAFACPVSFGAPDDRLVFHEADLDVAPRVANPLVAEQVEKFARALSAQMVPARLRDRVADKVRIALATGVRADRTAVARALGMSDATLVRRLEDERTTFKTVRDAVLWEAVEALLSNPALTVEAVALSVGFADVAAFSKAFKRWAGCPPSDYRGRLAGRQAVG